MKIAIFTLPLCNNYGGILQAYALRKALCELGHDAKVVNLRLLDEKKSHRFKEYIKFYVKKRLSLFVKKYKNQNYRPNFRTKLSQEFINNFIPTTLDIFSQNELKSVFENEKFDFVILGSDQVFRPPYFAQFSENFTLNFTNIDKISYAASFGGSKFLGNMENILIYKKELSEFKSHSVRESSAISLCKCIFNIEASLVLDPTLLLENYDEIIKNASSLAKDKILVYVLDMNEKKKNYIDALCKKFKKEPFFIDGESGSKNISINEWVKAFSEASLVITDSFHGSVFSIIFKKNFFAFVNQDRGSDRFDSLFSMLNLKDRAINLFLFEKDGYINEEEIDYNEVCKILHKKREESLKYLKTNLGKDNGKKE